MGRELVGSLVQLFLSLFLWWPVWVSSVRRERWWRHLLPCLLWSPGLWHNLISTDSPSSPVRLWVNRGWNAVTTWKAVGTLQVSVSVSLSCWKSNPGGISLGRWIPPFLTPFMTLKWVNEGWGGVGHGPAGGMQAGFRCLCPAKRSGKTCGVALVGA